MEKYMIKGLTKTDITRIYISSIILGKVWNKLIKSDEYIKHLREQNRLWKLKGD